MTVEENLLTACEPRDASAYLTTLVRPGVGRLPDDVHAVLDEFGLHDELETCVKDLPFGKRRAVAVARAVAPRPSILLLDEPAAGLSDHESSEMARVIRRLVDDLGLGVLVVEHDTRFVMALSDEVVVLDFGHCIAQGPPGEVRRDPAVIAAYLGEDPEAGDVRRHAAQGS
jgi:sulfate-transporting ATPase